MLIFIPFPLKRNHYFKIGSNETSSAVKYGSRAQNTQKDKIHDQKFHFNYKQSCVGQFENNWPVIRDGYFGGNCKDSECISEENVLVFMYLTIICSFEMT